MMEKTLVSKQYKKVNRFKELWHRLSQNKGAMLGLGFIVILVLVALTADLWIDYETQVIAINGKDAMKHPSAEHWMGTDKFGRDIFLRLIYGSRYSLAVGFVAVLISLCVGVVLGAFAGYVGGQTDILIMRALDIFDAVPTILLGVVIVSALGQSTLAPGT